MGAHLDKPVLDKETECGARRDGLAFAVASMQGWRVEQEDAHLAVLNVARAAKRAENKAAAAAASAGAGDGGEGGADAAGKTDAAAAAAATADAEVEEAEDESGAPPLGLFGVFDGHGGVEVSRWAAGHMLGVLTANAAFQAGRYEDALKEVFLELDGAIVTPDVQQELRAIAYPGQEQPEENEVERLIEDNKTELRVLLQAAQRRQARLKRKQRAGGQKSRVTNLDDAADKEQSESSEDEDEDEEEEVEEDEEEEDEDEDEGNQTAVVISRSMLAKLMAGEDDDDEEDDDDDDDEYAPRDPVEGESSEESSEDEAMEGKQPDKAEAKEEDKAAADEGAASAEGGDAKPSDEQDKSGPGYTSGCTAVVALLQGRERLFVANAGDSRAVLSRNGMALPLSRDHKPEDPVEIERILNSGGKIAFGRVNGSLNLTRSFGDHAHKGNAAIPLADQSISAMPDVKVVELGAGDDFLVIGCDGIWDSMSSQDVVDFVRHRLQIGRDLTTICTELCDECVAPKSYNNDGSGMDNETVILVLFDSKRYSSKAAAPPASSSGKQAAKAASSTSKTRKRPAQAEKPSSKRARGAGAQSGVPEHRRTTAL